MVLALLAALAALCLGAAEEVRELGVPVAFGVLDVGLEPQRVAQALLCEPDQVVVLVLRAGDLAGLLAACFHSSSALREWSGSLYPLRAPTHPGGARAPIMRLLAGMREPLHVELT